MTEHDCPYHITKTYMLPSKEITSHQMRQPAPVRIAWCAHPTDSPLPKESAQKGLGSRHALTCGGDLARCPIQHLL